MCDNDKRQAGDREAASREIVVTPEMIEAGIDAFGGHYPDAASDGSYARSAIKSILESALASGGTNRRSDYEPR